MSMSAAQARRQAVAQALEEAVGPVSAAALAERFSVSRQIIVGDVALLRAGGTDILATPRGYLLGGRGGGVERTVACVHAPEEMERELNAIVDAGGEVVDVIVEHPFTASSPDCWGCAPGTTWLSSSGGWRSTEPVRSQH